MRLAALQSLMNRELATYQVSRSHHDLLVSKRPSRYLPFCRPPLHLHSMGSSSPALSLLLEYVSAPDPLHTRTCSTASLRFRSPSRHQPEESTCGEFPTTHLVPLSVFHPLSAVSSSSDLSGLFHPKAASKIRFPGVFPATKLPRLIAASYPHGISEVRLLRSYPHSANFPRRTFKALLLVAIRNNRRWV